MRETYCINQIGQCSLIQKVALEPIFPLFLQIIQPSSLNSNLVIFVMCLNILYLVRFLVVIIHTTKFCCVAFYNASWISWCLSITIPHLFLKDVQ